MEDIKLVVDKTAEGFLENDRRLGKQVLRNQKVLANIIARLDHLDEVTTLLVLLQKSQKNSKP